jgi:hypothetical protein
MGVNTFQRVAYGLTDPLLVMPPGVIVSQRAPTGNDKAEIGTIWIDQPSNIVYILTSIVNNQANWQISGGGGFVISTLTGDVGGPVSPIAGNININGTQGALFTGTPGTLTLSFERLELGTSGGFLNPAGGAFSADGAVLQIYATTTGGDATLPYNGIFVELNVDVGDGSQEALAIEGRLAIESGANQNQAVGVLGYCAQIDNSTIGFLQAGVFGIVNVAETVSGQQAPNYIGSVIAKLGFDNAAAAPGPTAYLGGVISEVDYSTPLNNLGIGVLVTRDEDNGGTAGLAAFKVLQGTADRNDWLVGLDLYNSSATRGYTNADMRFWNQSFALSSAGNVTFSAVANTDWIFKLGDNAGANSLLIKSSTNVTKATIQSDGMVILTNNLQVTGAGHAIITPGAGGVAPAIVSGAGDPNGAVVAAKGSLYLRTDGSAVNDRAFINTDGNNTWTAIITAA